MAICKQVYNGSIAGRPNFITAKAYWSMYGIDYETQRLSILKAIWEGKKIEEIRNIKKDA